MTENNFLWSGQAEKMLDATLTRHQEENGLRGLLQERHKVVDFGSFMAGKLLRKDEADTDGTPCIDVEDDDKQLHHVGDLVGPAAGSLGAETGGIGITPSKASKSAASGVQTVTGSSSKKGTPVRMSSFSSVTLGSEGRGCLQEGRLGVPGVLPNIFRTAIFPRK